MNALSVCIRFIMDWDTDVNEFGIRLLYMIQWPKKEWTVLCLVQWFSTSFALGCRFHIINQVVTYPKCKQKCTKKLILKCTIIIFFLFFYNCTKINVSLLNQYLYSLSHQCRNTALVNRWVCVLQQTMSPLNCNAHSKTFWLWTDIKSDQY